MPRFLFITIIALVALTFAALPPLNTYMIERSLEQLSLNSLSQGGDYSFTIKEQQKGYFNSSFLLEFSLPHQSPVPLRLEVKSLGAGPKTQLFMQEQPLMTSNWQWRPTALQLHGRHKLDSSLDQLSQAQMETEIGLTHLHHQIKLPYFLLEDENGLLKMDNLSLSSEAYYPKGQFLDPQTTQWQHAFELNQLQIDFPELVLSIEQMNISHQFKHEIPLDNFSSQLNLQGFLLKQRGFPIKLDEVKMEVQLYADSDALTQLQSLINNEAFNDWKLLGPLVRPGITGEISRFNAHNKYGSIDLNASLSLSPTQLDGSPLGLFPLWQNLTIKVQGDADIALLENLLADDMLILIERAVSQGWIEPKARQLSVDLAIENGQLSLP